MVTVIDSSLENTSKHPYIVVIDENQTGKEGLSEILKDLGDNLNLGFINLSFFVNEVNAAVNQVVTVESNKDKTSCEDDLAKQVDNHEKFKPSLVYISLKDLAGLESHPNKKILDDAQNIIVLSEKSESEIKAKIPENLVDKILITEDKKDLSVEENQQIIAEKIIKALNLEKQSDRRVIEEYKNGYRINFKSIPTEFAAGEVSTLEFYRDPQNIIRLQNYYRKAFKDFNRDEFTAKKIYLNEIGFPYLYSAIANLFPNNQICVTDPKASFKGHEVLDNFEVKIPREIEQVEVAEGAREMINQGSLNYEWETFLGESKFDNYTVLHFNPSDDGGIFMSDEETIDNIKIPNLDKNKGIVLSNRATNVMFVTLSRALIKAGHPWVAIHTVDCANLTKEVAPALVVAGDEPQFIEAYPVKSAEKVLRWFTSYSSLENERKLAHIKEKLTKIQERDSNEVLDLELFKKYAYLVDLIEDALDDFSAINEVHKIEDEKATKDFLVEAVNLLLLPTSTPDEIIKTKQLLDAMNLKLKVFKDVFSYLFKNKNKDKNKSLSLNEVPNLSLENIKITGKNGFEELPESIQLQIKKIYQENYKEDGDLANKLLENFGKYLNPALNPSLYKIEYGENIEPQKSAEKQELVAFMRFSDVKIQGEDSSGTYRYAGALNVKEDFQGIPLAMNFIIESVIREFEITEKVFLRADKRRAKIYQRSLGAKQVEEGIILENEFVSGQESSLLYLEKEAFMRKIS